MSRCAPILIHILPFNIFYLLKYCSVYLWKMSTLFSGWSSGGWIWSTSNSSKLKMSSTSINLSLLKAIQYSSYPKMLCNFDGNSCQSQRTLDFENKILKHSNAKGTTVMIYGMNRTIVTQCFFLIENIYIFTLYYSYFVVR